MTIVFLIALERDDLDGLLWIGTRSAVSAGAFMHARRLKAGPLTLSEAM